MSMLMTSDHTAYRRWVNLIPSLLIPGAAHVLSGRKHAGLLWFLANLGLPALDLGLLAWPLVTANSMWLFVQGFRIALWAGMLADGCRKPIPRMGCKRWVTLVALAVAIPLALYLALRQFVVQPCKVPTRAMEPTLRCATNTPGANALDSDHFLVSKTAYWFHQPKRGDIIVFRTRDIQHAFVPRDQLYVKRVVGLPGDRVSIRPPFVCINGEKLLSPRIFEKVARGTDGFSGYVGQELLKIEKEEIVVGPGELLVLGDNSQNSLDGRHFGPIKRTSVVGKVSWIYWPPHRRGRPE